MEITDFKPKAFIFDLNGTMIDDMRYHTKAWHSIFTGELDKDISYASVKQEMYGKNQEVLERVFGKDRFTPEEMDKISFDKEKRYQEAYAPELALIPGLGDFLQKAKQNGILMAIGSAAINFNIDFVLDGLHIRDYFGTVVSADNVVKSKPDPETFLKCAQQLGVAPSDAVVFEDAPKGVESANNAGMKCIVLITTHEKEEFEQYPNVLGFITDYDDQGLTTFFKD